jgi:anaerobic selenocysteine-containing dehydrogenase
VPKLEIHPEDAIARSITDGSMVRVFNDRSECALARKNHRPRAVRRGIGTFGVVEKTDGRSATA